VNGIFIFVTFLLSLPALFLPGNRGWLRAQGWLVVVCATFTLGLGLAVWAGTLQTRVKLSGIWGNQAPLVVSLLQQKVSVLEIRLSWCRDDVRSGLRGTVDHVRLAGICGIHQQRALG
jgi:hypothetical protein